jgi:DNA recombination protein RmuC
MYVVLIMLGLLIAVGAAATLIWIDHRRSEQADRNVAMLRQELQALVGQQAQAISAQMGQLGQSMNTQLGQVRQELQSGVATTGKLTSDAQREVSRQLQTSNDAIRQISQQIGEVQKASQDLSTASHALETVLGGAKSRGALGEIALERLLEDALPKAAYEVQHRFATGGIVDAVVRSGDRLLCIDSKFPLEAYRRMLDLGTEARKDFSLAVRKHAESIAEKYILPGEHTLEFALMFVPSEGVYYELLMTEDSKYGRLDEFCRTLKVFPVSPNTCYAYLCAIAMSLRGLKVEENARRLLASMAGLQKQFDGLEEAHDKLGTHLRNAQGTYDDAAKRLGRARNTVDQMSEGTLPDLAVLPELPASETEPVPVQMPVQRTSRLFSD